MKKIFIAATNQNDGKTTLSLGFICNFQQRFKKVAFIKPIGQRYLEEEGLKIDEDSLLIEEVCNTKTSLKDMSPIAVEKGFTEKYISKPNKEAIARQINESFRRVSKGQDLIVIEGTGQAASSQALSVPCPNARPVAAKREQACRTQSRTVANSAIACAWVALGRSTGFIRRAPVRAAPRSCAGRRS
jgi:cobyric acid synthase